MSSKSENIELKPGYRKLIFAGLTVALIIVFLLDIFIGSVNLAPSDILANIFSRENSLLNTIIFKFRIPKALTAVFAGIALSVSGLQMQTVFRNPMAGPDVLGISSGASLGVAFVILGFSTGMSLGNFSGIGNWMLVFAAWLGAGLVMIIIMLISSRVKDILAILILGIMLSGGISAIVTIMQYFSSESLLKSYVVWTMGSLGNLTGPQVKVLILSITGGLVLSLFSSKNLNAMLLGENYARTIGLNVRLSRLIVFIGTSVMAGTVTAFCGPIGFIGVAVPHLSRIVIRTSDHKILLPVTILTGGIVMLICDIISQLPGSDRILPLNSVTSLIGIPVVIWILLKNRKYSTSF
jgi:iron complex transport system permease protein